MNTKSVRAKPSSCALTGWMKSLVLLAVVILSTLGCTKYPQVEIDDLHYVAALRTACNTKNNERLAKVAAAIDTAHAAGELNDAALDALKQIIALAEAGDWHTAEQECFRFQQDQLKK